MFRRQVVLHQGRPVGIIVDPLRNQAAGCNGDRKREGRIEGVNNGGAGKRLGRQSRLLQDGADVSEIVVNAEAAPERGFPIPRHVIRKSQAGAEVQMCAVSCERALGWRSIRCQVAKGRHAVVQFADVGHEFVAHTYIDGQPGLHAPIILCVKPERVPGKKSVLVRAGRLLFHRRR